MIKGSCHYNAVEFQIAKDTLSVRYCYCRTCRKLSGADYSCVARVDRSLFEVTKGSGSLVAYESRPGKARYYCKTCFAPIFVVTNNEQRFLRVRLGLLDDKPNVVVTGHMWVSEKPRWCTINDGLPTYLHEYTGG